MEAPRIVLLVSIDTLRPDHLGLYGYERFTSPVLDGIGREGVVFDDVSSPASWTLPSHVTMLTGLYPKSHGVIDSTTILSEGIPTLASLLAEEGYTTAAVVNVEWLRKENYYVTRDFQKYLWAPSKLDQRSASTWVTDQALQWIDEADGERLFVFMHYYDLHSDYKAEEAYEKLFVTPYDGIADGSGWQLLQMRVEDEYIEFCAKYYEKERCHFTDEMNFDDKVVKPVFGEADTEHTIQLYDAQIRQLDAELGRFLAALRQRGVLDDTLLVVTSDHGEEFGEHGRWEHFITTYEESIRVPLILRGPGLPAGVRVEAPVSLVDVVPTILALAGAEAPGEVDGSSLRPLWSGGSDAAFRERLLFGEASGSMSWNLKNPGIFPVYRSVRQGRFKLVYESKSDRYQLFDLEADPGEQDDLSESEPERFAALKAVMDERYPDGTESAGGEAPELSPEDLERLRALGYVP